MNLTRPLFLAMCLLLANTALGGSLALDSSPPALQIEKRGELVFQDGEFSYAPWQLDQGAQRVRVIQYFGASMGDSKKFESLTNMLSQKFPPGTVHVTTVLNLDAAMWGTTGMVVSEVKKSKKRYPLSTIVLDEEGVGVTQWQLGKPGSALVILDRDGVVKYIARDKLKQDQLKDALDILQTAVDG